MQRTQPQRTGRRFTLLDAIVVVAATAIAFAMVRGWQNPRWCAMPRGLSVFNTAPSSGRLLHYSVSRWISWTIPFAMTFSAALLALRFRSPRPRLARIVCQPGAVACAAALFVTVARMWEDALVFTLNYLTHPKSAIRLPSPPFVRFEFANWRQTWARP